jgi:hypothetical protein
MPTKLRALSAQPHFQVRWPVPAPCKLQCFHVSHLGLATLQVPEWCSLQVCVVEWTTFCDVVWVGGTTHVFERLQSAHRADCLQDDRKQDTSVLAQKVPASNASLFRC